MQVTDSPANCLVNSFLDQVQHPPEVNGDCLRLLVINFFLGNLDKYKAQILQEIEGEEVSLGVWCMKQINPDVYLGADFLYLLHEMTEVSLKIF